MKKTNEHLQNEYDIKFYNKIYGGISDRFHKRPEKKMRNCLRCRKKFASEGNRTCSVCEKINKKYGPMSHYQI